MSNPLDLLGAADEIRVHYYLFDLLYLKSYDTTALPLREREKLLRAALHFSDPLRFSIHRNTCGVAYFKRACRNGREGGIVKRADSIYVHHRSPDWLKFKCLHGQELVVGGFTKPRGAAQGFGALLLGYYGYGRLRYAGKVGTGFSVATRVGLREPMDRLRIGRCPFAGEVGESNATWIGPKLIAEVAFSEWTRQGWLRHPRFLGLRDDKLPRQVVRESPAVPK